MTLSLEITEVLESALSPTHLEVINESDRHNVPKGSESHFKVLVVTPLFANMRLIDRHRKINELLASYINNPIHALSIVAFTPEEWEKRQAVPESPKCRGGSS